MTDITDATHVLDSGRLENAEVTKPVKTPTPMPRIGIWSWSFVGTVIAAIIVVIALGALSEIVLPMTFAAVLAVVFKPLMGVEMVADRAQPTVDKLLQ